MSILYDETQIAIGEQAGRIVADCTDTARLLALQEQAGAFDKPFWNMAVEQGWTALAIPEEHGGMGLGLAEVGLVAQASGAGPAGAPFLGVSDAAAAMLLNAEVPELAQQWLRRMAAGRATGTLAFAEGGVVLPDRPETAFADGELGGAKTAITAGTVADFAIVWASRGDVPVLALADLTKARRRAVSGFDNARLHADLTFDGIPATLLCEGDSARNAAVHALARLAVVTAHEQVGGAEALLFAARDYAVTRKAFGQPIGAFQSVKHRLADLYGLVEIARANCIHAAACVHRPGFLAAAASARLSATEAYDTAARDAVQIHGGIGVTWESGLHLHMRRARSLAIEAGNMLFWEDLLVDELARAGA